MNKDREQGMGTKHDTKIDRREFLKLVGAAGAVVALPKILIDIDQGSQEDLNNPADVRIPTSIQPARPLQEVVQKSEEGEPQTGISIIDNIGIKKDGGFVDVVADSELMRENILSRARQMISPDFYPEVEAMVENLEISFGSRSYDEVGETKNGWFISKLSKISNLGFEPSGSNFVDKKTPLIYINTGQISDEDKLKEVWDHETSHFILNVDPSKTEGFLEGVFERTVLTVSVNTLLSAGLTLTVSGVISKIKNVGLRTYIEQNKKKFERNYLRNMKLSLIPSLLVSNYIHYSYFYDDEVNARKAVEEFPTPDDTFRKMIRVVPSDS